MFKNKKFVIVSVIILGIVFISLRSFRSLNPSNLEPNNLKPNVSYYTCGMHPSVRVSPQEYAKGKKNCPICNMNLTPVYKEGARAQEPYYGCGMEGAEHVFLIKDVKDMNCPICGMPLVKLSKEEADRLRGVVSKVKIKGEELGLAGVRTEPVKKLHLHKEIRTVGRVAYDPGLAIAQEEFISSLRAMNKIKESGISEVKERAIRLVESSKRKLRLLGLSNEQINELEDRKEIQTSLILPEEKMWIYGDVYEYELSWLKVGEKVRLTTPSLPGEEFYGVIASLNPVLDPKTRSVKFRAEVDNPHLKLKPEMYVDVVIESMYISPEGFHKVLAVPREAVLDTGLRKMVWVDSGNGEFQGREVKVGPEATARIDGKMRRYLPILSGLGEGELVVTRGNFLIDSQSQLTGQAAGAYGGALEAKEEAASPVHRH